MADAAALLPGLALGAWQAWRLRAATWRLLRGPRPSGWAAAADLASRLVPPLLLLGLLLARSPAAALAALGGYWLGRTAVLIHARPEIGDGG